VNKADLVSMVAQKAEIAKKDAEKAVDAVVQSIQEALSQGDKVSLVGSRPRGPKRAEPAKRSRN
jgi:DNA-binding protein HU-beta